jgi:hypothetical protein
MSRARPVENWSCAKGVWIVEEAMRERVVTDVLAKSVAAVLIPPMAVRVERR